MKRNDNPRDERASNADRPAESVRRAVGRSESPSLAVVRAVAAITNRRSTEMPPLYDYVDPDALDAFLESADGGGASASFAYDGVNVVASATHVVVELPR